MNISTLFKAAAGDDGDGDAAEGVAEHMWLPFF